jgi:hypothetical protein
MKEIKVTGRTLTLSESTKRKNPELFKDTVTRKGTFHAYTPDEAKQVEHLYSKPQGKTLCEVFASEAKTADVKLNAEPRKTTEEEKLNKLERARLAYLRMIKVPQLRIHAITLKLADDCRYTTDFTYLDANGRMVFEDTKGKQVWEDSIIKMKTAARMFPEFVFCIVKRSPNGWDVTEVKP